ncbi:MAG TPA: serine/threonine-protein kinase [Phycisphaerae bacterium]|nr:serine/threonine-protein kinase [Phycisphaerae bacterium]HRW55141.1 serine/threonine-protein kinase [Phycisphaerae bacterium]
MARDAESIFHAARDLPHSERSGYLDRTCGDDAVLRSRVAALLVADQEGADFLRTRDPDATMPQSSGASVTSLGEAPSDQIGRYKLLQRIGEGGFGTVWMAEQREPVKRRVALKIIKLGMDTKQVIARFEAERQALAMMDHPNIASVFDAGSTDRGRPYFVMELVRGVSIIEYCDRERLDTNARLKLFAKVCNAIQHAHQKGIIHRDIKPGNVLVTLHDGVPVPKVIDFGIAKATNQELTSRTLFTEHRQVVGTPAYMSPEQAEMSGLDIDTRSDIYSLGVLLYELLTGTPPFAVRELMSRGFGEMMRIIREETPHKPSTRWSTLGSASGREASQIAERRRTDVGRLGLLLRGDLDWIVMKCLEKDRRRRYETANGVAADIARHLEDEPVVAGPPSAGYRVRKFVRRHRASVLAGAFVAASLVLGVVGTTLGLLWALNEKSRAETAEAETAQRATELQQVADFQGGQLSEIDVATMGARLRDAIIRGAGEASRENVTKSLASVNFTNIALGSLQQTIFNRTIDAIDEQFADQPLVHAQLLNTTGETLKKLGLLDAASDPLVRALGIRRDILGADHPDTLASINDLGDLLRAQGSYDEAEVRIQSALDGRRRILGAEHPDTLESLNLMGNLRQAQGNLAEAERCFRETLDARRRTLGAEHHDTLISINNMGIVLQAQGRLDEAEPFYLEALKSMRRTLGDEHPDTLVAVNNMGYLLTPQGKYDEAESYFREALEGRRRTLGDEHPDTLLSINNMGYLLQAQGRYDEAEPYYREALDVRRRTLGDEHPKTLLSVHNMGQLLQAQGKYDEAATFYQEALDARRRTLGDEHPDTLRSLNNMGVLQRDQDRLDEAERCIREALTGMRKALGEQHPETLQVEANLSSLQAKREEAPQGHSQDASADE